ncbi:MAG: nitroreductase family protein [Nitrososphaerales archaeon]
MDTFECIRKKRDIRTYREEEIPLPVLLKILDAGRLSGSAMNKQPWNFVLIRDKEQLKKIAHLSPTGPYIENAAAAIAIATDQSNPYHGIDCGRCVQNMMLSAWNEGVGSCWVSGIDRKEISNMLDLPSDQYLFAIIPMGYPEQFSVKGKKTRRGILEVAYSEKFGSAIKMT